VEQKTKKEAAEYLGVSERAVERYAVDGRLNVYQEKRFMSGKTRLINLYDFEDLKKMKEEMSQPQQVRSALPVKKDALARSAAGLSSLAGLLKEMSAPTSKVSGVPLNEKLSLSLSEAAELSGYSESFLAEACRDGRLPAHKHGGWHITPENLKAFVSKLHKKGK
jgi:excisionase family DNA binding protein